MPNIMCSYKILNRNKSSKNTKFKKIEYIDRPKLSEQKNPEQ